MVSDVGRCTQIMMGNRVDQHRHTHTDLLCLLEKNWKIIGIEARHQDDGGDIGEELRLKVVVS